VDVSDGTPAAVAQPLVGPVLLDGPLTDAVITALRLRNEGMVVRSEGAYVRVECRGRCVLRASDVEDVRGPEFALPYSLETIMVSFSGRLEMRDGEAVWLAQAH